jgi:hypothetical protein
MRLFRDQDGIALPAALGVLAVVGTLSTATFAVSLRLNDTSTASRDAKRALAAADAGLEAATFRMNELGLQSESKCFTTAAIDPATGTDPETGGTPVAGECAGVEDDLGNGASYMYYVTPALDGNDECAGLNVEHADPNGQVTVTQRCITSIGEAGGERRRVQARVASYMGVSLFPVGGILGINGVEVKNNATVTGALGSNGQVELGNNGYVSGGVQLGSVSSPLPTLGNNSSLGGQVTYRTEADGAFVLGPPDFGNTATALEQGGSHQNSRITNGQDAGSNVTYTNTASSPRNLSLGNNGSLTLGGGTYNFCRVSLGNNARITIASSATVRFFLDSPDRAGSGCIPSGMSASQARSAGYGGLSMGNNSNFTNSTEAINLQMYFYGYTNGTHAVDFKNNSTFRAAVYAPSSFLTWNNNATIIGGVSARQVELKNNASFVWGGEGSQFDLSDLTSPTVSVYYRMAWTECRRTRTATSDPESGCSD